MGNEGGVRSLESWNRLDGKVVMVTGASSGLGREFCLNLAMAGCKIIAAARRKDRLKALCDEINQKWTDSVSSSLCDAKSKATTEIGAVAVELDLSAAGTVIDASVQIAWDEFGRIDALVNVAGVRDSNDFGRVRISGLSLNKGSPFIHRIIPELTITNVATRPRPSVVIPDPSLLTETSNDRKQLAAWASIRHERWEGDLLVHGEIPLWLRGTYLRNGPGIWNIGDYHFRHLFDGYATLVSLHFDNGRVTAAHRQIESEAYKSAMKNKKLCYREFSESPSKPPHNFLSYVGELANLFSGASLTDNANTGVVRLGDGRVICLTETVKGSIEINPETLETIGRFKYSDKLGGLIHSAHPAVTESELLTVLPDLINPGYRVVRMEAGTNERRVIGRVSCRGGPAPGWVHSFPVTEHHILVPEMPLRYCLRNLLRAEPTPLYKFEWLPQSKAFMHVMCKATGNIVASVEVPLFVTFHFINAYEKEDEDGRVMAIIADCCEHNADASILDKLSLHNLRSSSDHQNDLPHARVGRFIIPLDGSPTGELKTALDSEQHGRGIDMCSINPSFLGKKYRYAYACGARRPCNFPNTLTKIDLLEKTAQNWHEEGAVPSEPFFVARPGATAEDDGVVISMVSDKNGGGYALLLDGTTFEEIARAQFPYGLPYGLHGCWVPKKA